MTERDEVLIVEDEPNVRELVRDVLGDDGLEVHVAENLDAARAFLARRAPSLMLLDVKLPDGDGLTFLDGLRDEGNETPAIVITAFGTVDRAVQAMRAGASDFLVKPFDNERLRGAVAGAIAAGRRMEDVALSAGVVEESDASRPLIGASGGLADVVRLLRRVASLDATVLIQGESGTGKELVARALHDSSPRLDEPFVSIDCSAIAPTLIESELFGFERGAFTGAHAQKKGLIESANGGTLFLDEIGDMPLDAQSRLLRVLQEREITRVGGRAPVAVDVRVVAATHRNMPELVESGAFRLDLFHRLNVVPIRLPPLRERRQDIPGLIDHFLTKHAAHHGLDAPAIDDATQARLAQHTWPGNVRELENFVERAVILGAFDFSAWAVVTPKRIAPIEEAPAEPDAPVQTIRRAVRAAERKAVVQALRHARGNKAAAARLLGISYKTLFNKIHEHDIKEDLRID
ncbi:MAG: sigma-54 dependent transcriptional regulator [Deltaproteobacteria bacterium]